MRKSILGVTAGIVLMVAITSTHAEKFNAQKGDLWVGGGLDFVSTGVGYNFSNYNMPRRNKISLSPIIRIFPADNFALGPKLSWAGWFENGSNYYFWGIGGEFGYVSSSKRHPYIIASPHVNLIVPSGGTIIPMFMLPFTTGVTLPISGDLGLQFEVGYRLGFQEDMSENTISIGIGVCGLGDKVAISMINMLDIFSSTLSSIDLY